MREGQVPTFFQEVAKRTSDHPGWWYSVCLGCAPTVAEEEQAFKERTQPRRRETDPGNPELTLPEEER